MSTKKTKPKATRTRGHYPPTLKRELAQRYLAGEFSYGAAADQYGLASKEVVKEFVRWYKRELDAENTALAERAAELRELDALPPATEGADVPMPDDVAQLKMLLQDARDEATVWRTLVRVAEEQTGLAILKKPIAKPPVR